MTRVLRMQRGFTLIEILVAMAILAIAMAALTRASGDNAGNAAYLREPHTGHVGGGKHPG